MRAACCLADKSAGLRLVGTVIKPPSQDSPLSKTEKASPSALGSNVAQAPATAKVSTKSAAVLTLLKREQGATLAELADATGWQPHTTRAMLTGLRKKGYAIERGKRDDATVYCLPVANA